MFDGIPAGVGGNGILGIGNQGHLIGLNLCNQIDEFWDGIAFDIEFGGQYSRQGQGVIVADVALIRPGMNGNALSTEALQVCRNFEQVGYICPTGISQCGDFIDVYT